MSKRVFSFVLIGVLSLSALLTGCTNAPDAPPTVPVSGKITFGGGPWPAEASLSFVPVASAGSEELHSATADIEADGTFKASTFAPGDGLSPGRYQVAVRCWKVAPADSEKPESYIPIRFHDGAKSGFEVDVPKGSPAIKLEAWDVPMQ